MVAVTQLTAAGTGIGWVAFDPIGRFGFGSPAVRIGEAVVGGALVFGAIQTGGGALGAAMNGAGLGMIVNGVLGAVAAA